MPRSGKAPIRTIRLLEFRFSYFPFLSASISLTVSFFHRKQWIRFWRLFRDCFPPPSANSFSPGRDSLPRRTWLPDSRGILPPRSTTRLSRTKATWKSFRMRGAPPPPNVRIRPAPKSIAERVIRDVREFWRKGNHRLSGTNEQTKYKNQKQRTPPSIPKHTYKNIKHIIKLHPLASRNINTSGLANDR